MQYNKGVDKYYTAGNDGEWRVWKYSESRDVVPMDEDDNWDE
jgi:hypothetical protein